MTIDEAIKSLERYFMFHREIQTTELDKAAKLGLEALKEVKELREVNDPAVTLCLPGETKDEVKSNYPVYNEKSDEVYRP